MSREEQSTGPLPVTDPKAMRAVTHPVRLALLEALTFRGPLTATQAGELIEESPTTCSFHLRQLAKYGFVEEAGRGKGRARPWRVRQIGFESIPGPAGRAGQVASEALTAVALHRQVARHEHSRPQGRSHMATVWWVTEDERADLQEKLEALVDQFKERLADPSARPAEASPVEFVVFTHLFENLMADQPPGADDPAATER